MYSHTFLGMQTGVTSAENLPISNTGIHAFTLQSKNPTLEIYSEDTLPTIQKYIFTKLLIVALFVTTKSGKLPTSPHTEEGLNKLWYIYKIEY